jgi:IclR family transcriptional regulator, KDG regulon repressor
VDNYGGRQDRQWSINEKGQGVLMTLANKHNLTGSPEKKNGTQAINRALAILGCFNLAQPAWNAADLSGRLHLTLPTTKRILKALESEGILAQSTEPGAYELGLRVFELGMVASSRIPLLNMTKEVLAKLRDETNATVHLATVDGDDILYIKKIESLDAFGITSPDGLRRSLATGSLGKAILSTYPPAMRDAYLARHGLGAFTSRSIIDPKTYIEELERVREQGFALDQEELIRGVCGVAAPIADGDGPAIGGIAIAFPATRFDPEKVLEWGQLVRQAGLAVSHRYRF